MYKLNRENSTAMNYPLLKKYNVDKSLFRPISYPKMEEILKFCEKNNLKILTPAFTKYPVSGNSIVHYLCSCGEAAQSMCHNFLNKTVYACKKCNAKLINKIFKPIKLDTIISKIQKNGFEVVSHNHETNLAESTWTLKCKFGHIFKKSGVHIQEAFNCTCCYSNSSEELLARVFIEANFDKKFPSSKPHWLINKFTNHLLELDLYNEEMKIAFEYNGPQHYLPIYGKKRLDISIRNDSEKKQRCKENGVKLFVIPYFSIKTINKKDFFMALEQFLLENGFHVKPNLVEILSNQDFEINTNRNEELINNLKKLLSDNNKTWISGTYLNVSNKINVKCNNCSHEYSSTIKSLLNLRYTPKTTCIKCTDKSTSHKNAASKIHKKRALTICKKMDISFHSISYNKNNHFNGFFFLDNNLQPSLIGLRKYRKHVS